MEKTTISQNFEFLTKKLNKINLGYVSGTALSFNHNEMITVCPGDQTLKIFDVLNFDLNNMIKLNFIPGVCEFVGNITSKNNLIAV